MIETPPDEFQSFQKIARLNRNCVITEKIDGTNAQVLVLEDGTVKAGSRNRWVTPESDNMGFARWVKANEDELRTGLGFGRHFGEWWGQGIQRRYGLQEKRFSLFNVGRWNAENKPACCHVVPTLFEGLFSTGEVMRALCGLHTNGSQATPGFMKPEGIVIFHAAAGTLFKVTLEGDEAPKSLAMPSASAP